MNDSPLIVALGAFLKSALDATMLAQGIAEDGWEITQKAQPTQQGTSSKPSVFFQLTMDLPRGYPRLTYDYKVIPMTETVLQAKETTFKISTLFKQDPSSSRRFTAHDMLVAVHMAFMSPVKRQPLLDAGINILKIQHISNEAFEDDRHMFEYHPGFDVVLTHYQVSVNEIPSTNKITGTFERI